MNANKKLGILPSELGIFIMPCCLHKFLKNADVISNLGGSVGCILQYFMATCVK